MARKSTTRDRLVRTATELFSRQGYGQTGVNEIMQQARATSGSFYHFFPAKEDLLLAVLDHVGETLHAEVLGPAAEGTEDPIERVFAVLAYYRRYLVDTNFALGSPMGNLAAELSESHPQVRSKVSELFAAWTAEVEAFLGEAGDRLPPDLDNTGLAEFVLSTMEGAVMQARARRSLAPFDSSVAQLRRYFDLLRGEDVKADEVPASLVSIPRKAPQNADWRSW